MAFQEDCRGGKQVAFDRYQYCEDTVRITANRKSNSVGKFMKTEHAHAADPSIHSVFLPQQANEAGGIENFPTFDWNKG